MTKTASRIEMVVDARFLRDVLEALREGMDARHEDPYRYALAKVLGVDESEVSDEQCAALKTVSFGARYGVLGDALQFEVKSVMGEVDDPGEDGDVERQVDPLCLRDIQSKVKDVRGDWWVYEFAAVCLSCGALLEIDMRMVCPGCGESDDVCPD
jgi:hypothetical protein